MRAALPELPRARAQRFVREYDLPAGDAALLATDRDLAAYFEAVLRAAPHVAPRTAANWLLGEVFGWLNASGQRIDEVRLPPEGLADLLDRVACGKINLLTAKDVLAEMLDSGRSAAEVIEARGLAQITDGAEIARLVDEVIAAHPAELERYLAGKESLANWFFGMVMQLAGKRAHPAMLRAELERQLAKKRRG